MARPFDLSSTTGLHKDASPRCQGATGAPPDDASALARSRPPWSPRWRRAPEAPRPLRRIPKNRTGEGGPWLTRTRARARTRRLRVLACNTHNAGAVPRHEARIRTAHRRAVCPVCVFCGGARVPAAPRRTGIRAEAIECFGAVAAAEYVLVHDVFFRDSRRGARAASRPCSR